jgi:hypothetical protein
MSMKNSNDTSGIDPATFRFLGQCQKERDQWGDPGVDGRIILGWIFRKWDVGVGTELSWLRIQSGGGHL